MRDDAVVERATAGTLLERARHIAAEAGRPVVDMPDLLMAYRWLNAPDVGHAPPDALPGGARTFANVRAQHARAATWGVRPERTSVSPQVAEFLQTLPDGPLTPEAVAEMQVASTHNNEPPPIDAPLHPSVRKQRLVGGPEPAVPPYTVDLVGLAIDGALDPVIAREGEIATLVRVLHRRRKPNPLLVGLPGVGKSAIVEALAQRIAAGAVPPRLQPARLLMVDIAALLGGTRYRGDFEARLRNLLDASERSEHRVILFVDEIQVIVGTGHAEGGMDASSILLPALARGRLSVIGATTPAEHTHFFATDSALARRFETVQVAEPSPSAALEMLRGLMPVYERHHGVQVTAGALDAAVELSVRGAPERHLPDKAIDLIDEACAMVACGELAATECVDVAAVQRVAESRGWPEPA